MIRKNPNWLCEFRYKHPKSKNIKTKIILEDRQNGHKMMSVQPNIIKIWYKPVVEKTFTDATAIWRNAI